MRFVELAQNLGIAHFARRRQVADPHRILTMSQKKFELFGHCRRGIGDDRVEPRQGSTRMIAESDHALAQEGGGRDGDAIEVEIDRLRLDGRTRGGDQLSEELTAGLHATEHRLAIGQSKKSITSLFHPH